MRDINKILESLSPEKRALLEKKLKEKAENYNAFPLSYQQKRLWFLDQLEPGNLSYNIPLAIKLTGKLDAEKVIEAINVIVKRHDILRSNIVVVNENPILTINEKNSLDYSIVDISQLKDEKKEDKLNKLLNDNLNKYFHLSSDQLFFIQLIKLNDDKHILQVVMHHIISDGWSLGLFIKEFTTIYTSLVKHEEPKLEELKIQYTDYAKWQNEWSESDNFKSQLKYWKEKFKELPPKLNLPYDIKNSKNLSNAGIEFIKVKQDEVSIIKSFLSKNKITGFIFFITILKILFQKVCRENDISIGTPIANRNRKEIENLIGFFVNTLVLRTQIDSDNTFEQLLQTEKRNILEAFDNQDLPFEYLVESINPERDMDSTPLFQVMFVYQNINKNLLTLDELEIEPIEQSNATVKFDLTFNISESENDFVLSAQYNKNKFSQNIISTLLNSYYALIRNIIINPLKPIKDVPLYYDLNYSNLSYISQKFNFNPSSRLEELFERSVNNYGESIALKSDNSILTYNELNILSNKLANYLLQNGIQPNQLIGIHLERDINIIVSIIAIFKIGAAYLPLDPIYPSDRINYMIMDSGVQFIISNNSYSSNINSNSKIIDIDEVLSDDKLSSNFDRKIEKSINNTAYVIYTSGSTGKPKGTVVTQYNILRLFESCDKLFSFNNKDVWTLFHSYSFDFSVWEIWGALLHGSQLLVISQNISRQPDEFYRICKKEGVTVLNQTPSAFTQFISVDSQYSKDDSISTLRYVIFGGEALKFSSLIPWLANHDIENPKLINMYGITETTVHVTYKKITKEEILSDNGSNIGIPLPDLEISIMDDGLHPLPIGFAGEICVSGGGVASGYLNRDTLTKEKFINNPISISNCKRLYRSGDLGVINRNGELIYLGRIDKQIQLRGFRIELGEIEDVLNKVESVNNSVVTPYSENDELKYLVAYITTSKNISSEEIKKTISTSLPDYMIPNYFIVIDELPLTENGKVDYAKLPKPSFTRTEKKDIVSASTETEKLLVEVWKNLLSVNLVSIDDDFFNLGGHSLLATKMVARIKKSLNVNIPLRLLFENPILKELASAIDYELKNDDGKDEYLITKNNSDIGPLSFAQQRLWFIDKIESKSRLYNIPSVFNIKGKFNLELLEKSLNKIIQRHSILRTTFETIDEKPVQKIHDKLEIKINKIDLSDNIDDRRKDIVDEIVERELNVGFDLNKLPLFKISVIVLDKNEFILVSSIHHIISDGWSSQILLNEFLIFYKSLLKQESIKVPKLEIQYIDYSKWQREYFHGEVLENYKKFWKSYLEYAPTLLNLPTDYKRPEIQSYNGDIFNHNFTDDTIKIVKDICDDNEVSPFMFYYTVFGVLIHRISNQSEIIIGTPVANRENADIQNLIGLFVNSIPLRVSIESNIKFIQLLKNNKKSILDAFEYKDYPFEKIIDVLNIERNPSYSPLFQVMFTYNSLDTRKSEFVGFDVKEYKFNSTSSKFDVSVTIQENYDNTLTFSYEYNTDLFKKETIVNWNNYFVKLISEITKNINKNIFDYKLTQNFGFKNKSIISYEKDFISQLLDLTTKYSDKIALVYDDNEITYGVLIQYIKALSKKLIEEGIKEGDFVGIYLDRSIEFVISMFSIINIGATFVPIDKKYPRERVEYIISDLSLKYIIAFDDNLFNNVKHVSPSYEPNNSIKLNYTYNSLNNAYVIYTSGTTGQPKGVVISNDSLNMFINSAAIDYKLNKDDKILQFSSLGFDTCIEEIFPILYIGGTVHLRTEELLSDNQALLEYVNKHQLTILDLPSAYWEQLIGEMKNSELSFPECLRTIIIGGEKASIDAYRKFEKHFIKNVKLLNTYGPTEATVVASYWDSSEIHETYLQEVPIGKNLSSCNLYVLDDDLNPVPMGIVGKLFITGKTLAISYYNKPQETANSFIPDPFSLNPGSRMYRTGDLVRIMEDGNIEYIGREDKQIKIRGFRIEIDEIENNIKKIDQISECVVVERIWNGKNRIVCFYTSNDEYDYDFFKKKLIVKLPDYMIPSSFIKIDNIPLNVNGKIDFNKLKSIKLEIRKESTKIIPPTTEKEILIHKIWSEMFSTNEFGITHNFFELGGDSIIGIQFISKLRQNGYEINPVDIFKYQTIQELALVLKESKKSLEDQSIIKAKYLATPIQRQFIDKKYSNPNHWNQSLLFETSKLLNIDDLRKVIIRILEHHDALRTLLKDGYELEITDEINIEKIFSFHKYISNGISEEEFIKNICNELQASLDLKNGPIVKVAYIELNKESRLFITVHHVAIDGVSWRILLEDIQTLYKAYNYSSNNNLLPKTTPFNKWADQLIKYVQTENIEDDKTYWLQLASKNIDDLLPDNDGVNNEESTSNYSIYLNEDQTDKLLKESVKKYNTKIDELLLTALIRSYSVWKGKRKLIINLEGHGRDNLVKNLDVSRTVGWFTSLYPVYLDLKKSIKVTESINTIKENIRNIPNKGFTFGLLRYLSEDEATVKKLQVFDNLAITFNYLGQVSSSKDKDSLFKIAKENKGIERDLKNKRDSILSITATIINNKLHVSFAYSSNQFIPSNIKHFADTYKKELDLIINVERHEEFKKSATDFSMANLDNKKLNNVLSKLKKK